MTTIACNREEMAADSLTIIEDLRFGRNEKVRRVYRGLGNPSHLVAGSGQSRHINRFLEWYGTFDAPERPDLGEDFAGLALTPEGIFYYDGGCYGVPMDLDYWAIGSGAQIALGAMAMGASPKEAVVIACGFDVGSGGPVRSERLDAPKLVPPSYEGPHEYRARINREGGDY